jgi:hypothetical protein
MIFKLLKSITQEKSALHGISRIAKHFNLFVFVFTSSKYNDKRKNDKFVFIFNLRGF